MSSGASQGGAPTRSVSLPAKVLLVSVLVGGAVWWIVNMLWCPLDVSDIFNQSLDDLLREKARQQRVGLSQHILLHRQTVNFLAASAAIREYMEGPDWKDTPAADVDFLDRPPKWLPEMAGLNLPLKPRYLMVLNSRGEIKEVYQARPDPFPAQFFHLPQELVENSHDRVVLTILKGGAFLFASESIKGERGEVLGSLMLFSPVDDEFFRMSNGEASEWNLIVLLDGETQKVVASNQPKWIPKGMLLGDLEQIFQVAGMAAKIDGSEVYGLQIVSLVQQKATASLSEMLQKKERINSVIQAFLYMVPLLVIVLWLTRRITNLTRQIEIDTDELVGPGELQAHQGDQLKVLEQRIKSIINGLKTRTSQLETVNRELDNITYAVSHDLRAPLRSIDGFSQALEEDSMTALDEDGRDYLRRVRKATQRLESLIDSLLNLSRINRQELRIEPVNLSHCAKEVIDNLRQSEPERTVNVMIADGVVAQGDPQLLHVVMTNLLENAWKFSAKRVDSKIEFGAVDRKDLRSEILTDKHVYFLRDNGVGFDMSFAEQMFGPFQRLHRTEEFPGVGIGLATVQRIIQRHGGRIWAEGEIDRGATFYFYF